MPPPMCVPPFLPKPVYDLRWFSPFVDWALTPVHSRCQKLGLSVPENSIWSFLVLSLATESSHKLGMSALSTPLDPDVKLIQSVVAEMGWLTWVDYIYLILASARGSIGGQSRFVEWSRNEKVLQKEVLLLEDLMAEAKTLEPFLPILREIIRRCLAELELKKTYLDEVRKRHCDFLYEGRSLNFGVEDLESDKNKDSGLVVTMNNLSE